MAFRYSLLIFLLILFGALPFLRELIWGTQNWKDAWLKSAINITLIAIGFFVIAPFFMK